MGEILHQLDINSTVFIQVGIFFVVYMFVSSVFLKPYLQLFQVRRQRTVEDRKAAQKLMADAQAKLEEYQRQLGQARDKTRQDFDQTMKEVRKSEALILFKAREEVKNLMQKAAVDAEKQKAAVVAQVALQLDGMASQVSDRLLKGEDR